jgi:large subunit ribosomal protein L3
MSVGLLGKKLGMTQIFKEDGERVPVTLICAGPCAVVQKKSDNNGTHSVQLGFGDIRPNKVDKALTGHFKKANLAPKRFLREFRVTKDEASKYNVGDELKVNIFEKGGFVDVTSNSKGRGYTGVIKRHNFHRPNMTHGTHEFRRHGGSIGCRFPQRTHKGKKMPGHYGADSVTVQNLEIIDVVEDQNLLVIRGAVPGHNNTFVRIRKALKKPAFKK